MVDVPTRAEFTQSHASLATSITDNEAAIARLRETVEALTAGVYGHANDSAVHHKHDDAPTVGPWFAKATDGNTQELFRLISPAAQRVELPDYDSKRVDVNTISWSIPLVQARDSDGPRTILARANGQYYPAVEVTVPHWRPDSQPDPEADGVLLMLMPDGRTLYEIYGFRDGESSARAISQFDVIDGSAFNAVGGWPRHKYEERQPHGTRAAGITQTFGVLRPEDITGEPLPHALVVGFGAELLGPPRRSAYVFPAISADWGAASVYKGSNKMGTQISTDVDCTSLMETDAGRTIAATLWLSGAYAMDLAGSRNVVLYADPSLVDVMTAAADDLAVIGQHIRMVVTDD